VVGILQGIQILEDSTILRVVLTIIIIITLISSTTSVSPSVIRKEERKARREARKVRKAKARVKSHRSLTEERGREPAHLLLLVEATTLMRTGAIHAIGKALPFVRQAQWQRKRTNSTGKDPIQIQMYPRLLRKDRSSSPKGVLLLISV
jgi:hypothetical protein